MALAVLALIRFVKEGTNNLCLLCEKVSGTL